MLGAAETRALADEMIGSFGPYDDAWGDARLGSPSRASSTAPTMPSRKSAFAGEKGKAAGLDPWAGGFAILVRLLSEKANDRTPLPAALDCRGIGRLASAKNDQVTLLGQATGIDSKRKMPMTLVLVMIFNILVALALGFVLGRIYQIRRDELECRDGLTLPPTTRTPQP